MSICVKGNSKNQSKAVILFVNSFLHKSSVIRVIDETQVLDSSGM